MTNTRDVFVDETPGPDLKDPKETPYSPDKDRERVRAIVAITLLGLLAAVILIPMIAIVAGSITWDSIQEFEAQASGITAGLVGAVAGFYFAENKR